MKLFAFTTAVSSFPHGDQHSPLHQKNPQRPSLCRQFLGFLWENNTNEIWQRRIKLSCISEGVAWLSGHEEGGCFSLLNRKSILNSLPHLLLLANSREALKSYLIIKHEKLWTIDYYQMRLQNGKISLFCNWNINIACTYGPPRYNLLVTEWSLHWFYVKQKRRWNFIHFFQLWWLL